jgi:hypothetical protein
MAGRFLVAHPLLLLKTALSMVPVQYNHLSTSPSPLLHVFFHSRQ